MGDLSISAGRAKLIQYDVETNQNYDEYLDDQNINLNFKEDDEECYKKLNICCGNIIGCLRAWVPCVCCCADYPFIEVPQSSKSILERFGRPIAILEPGLHQINTCVDQVKTMSFKIKILDLPKQTITTKDNVLLYVDAVIYYRVVGIMKALYKIENLPLALIDQSTAAIRSVFGEMVLTKILDSKEELSDRLERLINEQSKKWGTLVEEIFFKDIAFGKQTQDDMAAAAKQRRIGESLLISNKADVEAAMLLKQTADILDSKAAMQVRYLEVIQNITKSTNDQVLFLPLDTTPSKK